MENEFISYEYTRFTKDREDAINLFNEFLEELGVHPLSEKELQDWDIRGGESYDQLYEWARDLASEIHTEKCASKNAWRYEH